jgi:hypothetical protein
MRVPLVSDLIDGVVGTAQWLGHTFIGTPVNFIKDVFGIGTSGASGAIEGGQMGFRWGLLLGGIGNGIKVANEGGDVISAVGQGAFLGATALAAGGAGIGALAGAAPEIVNTASNLGSNLSQTAVGLFPSGGGASVQNLPSNLPPKTNGQKIG